MKRDHVMLRLPCIYGPQWLQAYALVDLAPGIDPFEFREELPKRLNKFHEVENYLGGTPGDLFIGFFANGQTELLNEISKIKAMKEVITFKEWAIANFPVGEYELTKDDWNILIYLRKGNVTEELVTWFKPEFEVMMKIMMGKESYPPMPIELAEKIGKEINLPAEKVKERMEYMQTIPKGVMLQEPDPSLWDFTEIHFSFNNCTFADKAAELMKLGMPFAAESHSRQGAIMVEPETLDDLKESIKNVNKIKDVNVCDFAFSEDMLWTQPWLDDFMAEQLKNAK
ncbi:hypothetical protein ACFL20_09250 [Spirochaetota bacterium]